MLIYKDLLFPLKMKEQELLPHLFRTEYRKLIAVLCKHFGFDCIEIAEDIASDTFLLATETWGFRGLPENPTAWLYTVAKNKATDYLKRNKLFDEKITLHIEHESADNYEMEIDLSNQNIADSQLQMIFAVCHPSISTEAQIGLALRILCGFGIEEIANAFLTNKETINKRLTRAKEKLRTEKVKIEFPGKLEINQRLDTVLTTLYLLFSEGYYSSSQDVLLRKDLCLESMRLTYLLIENGQTNKQNVNALLSLMCFQASRFEARVNQNGESILYQEQDKYLWDTELIARGEYFLTQAAKGKQLSKYHLEAGIAFWHTRQTDTTDKWKSILLLYNQLLQIDYSPMAALNRTYALSKVYGKARAVIEAKKLNLSGNYLYHSLLGELYSGVDNPNAIVHFQKALTLSKSTSEKVHLLERIELCKKINR